MADLTRVGIIGAGWPGQAHARGYKQAGGFRIVAVADLIPERRQKLRLECSAAKEYADAKDLLRDREIDAVSICLPTHLHVSVAVAALRARKHVMCETPPLMHAKESRQIESTARNAGKVVLYGFQRRFGGAEQAAGQAIAKGYAGEVYHARAAWMRTRGIPIGTGWFVDKCRGGGGALIDIGVHMLDLAWHLLGEPKPQAVFGAAHRKFRDLVPEGMTFDVEDSAFALIRFEGGKSLELSASWALNQPPQQQGTICRIYGDKAAVDVYTPAGAVLYRGFDAKGQARPTPLHPPRLAGHTLLMRHFRQCILKQTPPLIGPRQAVVLMQMIDGIYKSAATGKSVQIR